MSDFESAYHAFDTLNKKIPYLVIRNFEGFYESVLSEDHADIDLLCLKKDRKHIIKLLNATPRLKKNDGIHYCFTVANEKIPLDIRYAGDGYYDKLWETHMLNKRIKDERGFYRMDNENYFWSLLYHALYHKGTLSDEYKKRLEGMKPALFPCTDDDLDRELNDYLRKNGYHCTIAKDKYLWYRFSHRCSGNIKAYPLYNLKHGTVRFCKKIKRIFKH